jgi:CheY-like chemotaxis protein
VLSRYSLDVVERDAALLTGCQPGKPERTYETSPKLGIGKNGGPRHLARLQPPASRGRLPLPSSNDQILAEAETLRLRGVRVLIVEDAWQVAAALKAVLEDLRMEVLGPVATILEAERLTAAHMPEVAVIDVNLKGEMAYGLISQLHDRGVPVIVVTGYAVLPRLTEKAAAILQKPFNGPELITALRQAVDSCRPTGDAGH